MCTVHDIGTAEQKNIYGTMTKILCSECLEAPGLAHQTEQLNSQTEVSMCRGLHRNSKKGPHFPHRFLVGSPQKINP